MNKVSVIITTHNREKCLEQSVTSVLNQTYKNIECIIVDDASEEKELVYLKELNDKRVKKIFIKKENSRGGNYARNQGIKESTGKYIAFLDDDDIWMPDKIEKQVKELEKSKDVGLVYCGRVIYVDEKFAFYQPPEKEYSGNLNEKVFGKIFCTTSSIMIKKEVVDKCGLFDENLKFWQEYDFLIRICQNYNISYVDEPLMIFRNNFKDKNRLSNKYVEWKNSVNYIYNKYDSKIKTISEEIKNKMKLIYLENAVSRCYSNKNNKEKRKMLKEIYKLQPSKTNFVKWLFNLSPQQIIYLKYYFKKYELFDINKYIEI